MVLSGYRCFLVVFGVSLWLLVFIGSCCWLSVVPGRTLIFLRFLVDFGDCWWVLVVLGGN